MGWKHPLLSLQEMVNLVKGFVEILILGSGYQSTGVFANWDVLSLRQALQWAEFFESFFLEFRNSEYYQESVKELDGVLSELTSTASFPQGQAHLSSTTLTSARKLVVEQLIRGLPLRSDHLRSVIMAAVETDLSGLSNVEDGSLSRYLSMLTLQSAALESTSLANGFSEFSWDSCSTSGDNMNEKLVVGGCTSICIQALLKRQSFASRALDLVPGLNVIADAVASSNLTEYDETFLKDKLWAATNPMNEGNEQEQANLLTPCRWKARALSFLLDKRTVRLVSGTRILFSAPEVQWMRQLDQLNVSEGPSDDCSGAKVVLHRVESSKCLEKLFCSHGSKNGLVLTLLLEGFQLLIEKSWQELLLVGCIARRWQHIIKHFSSISFSYGDTSEMFSETCNLLPERHERLGDMTPSVQNALIEYLTKLLNARPSLLWRLHPILPAVAIPSSSPLFKVYLSKIESLLRDDSPISRCCPCYQEKKEHTDCELAERIWYLHASHIRGSCLWRQSRDD